MARRDESKYEMQPRNEIPAVERLAISALAGLPDSRKGRRELLLAVRASLPAGHGLRTGADHLLRLMSEHDEAQAQLLRNFCKESTP